MFDKMKNRIAALERELAAVKGELAELKTNFGHLTGENHGLREQNNLLRSFGICPGKQIKRHEYPDYAEEGKTRQDGL